ncbi:hypothetical protein QA641_09805 [Bradyrhizobium sp. CB1650]|uniref:hypothetical protein n=1 Tax=Bradyrhizobium sp. CB1650 TaxID=3039153 RepID=UPI002434D07F|nr:hypothetical protein [Bradyrhizobium sp. CB1650]WGD54154.1 hypothetical protein QA641_09805 [Bradyrhizobium sp. CB1650]
MPFHVYSRSGADAVGVIVETAQDALTKAAEFMEDGHLEVSFRDLFGNILDGDATTALAEGERRGS